jgi:hypothetical protein
MQWLDSQGRFVARVSRIQDLESRVRLELSAPLDSQADGEVDLFSQYDDLFLQMQEVLFLRPHHPSNRMLQQNPGVCEVEVHVDDFWSAHESGGNAGNPIRTGTVYVGADTDTLQKLLGKTDTRFTRSVKKQRFSRSRPMKCPKGLNYVLSGGIQLRRMRTVELETPFTGSRWLCVDYAQTHSFVCQRVPCCTIGKAAFTNPQCVTAGEDTGDAGESTGLYLSRDPDNVKDANAIRVTLCTRSDPTHSVGSATGFVPRELAACLAPALDANVIVVSGPGVYRDRSKDTKDATRVQPVWFQVDAGPVSAEGKQKLQEDLRAIPWWVSENPSTEQTENPVEDT